MNKLLLCFLVQVGKGPLILPLLCTNTNTQDNDIIVGGVEVTSSMAFYWHYQVSYGKFALFLTLTHMYTKVFFFRFPQPGFIGVDVFSVLYPQIPANTPVTSKAGKMSLPRKVLFLEYYRKTMVPCETEMLLKKFNLTKIHRQKFELHVHEISPISRTSDICKYM